MHLIIDLARDLAIVAIELLVLISLGWYLSRNSAGDSEAQRQELQLLGEMGEMLSLDRSSSIKHKQISG